MSFQSFRASLDSATSRRLMYVLFAGQAVVVGSIMYQQRHGNPVKVARDEHGVMRFQSLREYLTDEIKMEEIRLRENPGDEGLLYDLELKKAALRKELDRLDSLQFLSERDVPLREEDLR